MLSTPTPLEQAALFIGLLALVGLVLVVPAARVEGLRFLGWAWTSIAQLGAWCAYGFHWLMPADERNGQLPRNRLIVWSVANASIVAVWLTGRFVGRGDFFDIVGWICLLFATVNLWLVIGAYCALREGVAIMNADEGWMTRKYEIDVTAVRNAGFVAGSVAFLVLQTAAVLHWLQSIHGVGVVRVTSSLGSTYFDILVAMGNSLPFVQTLVGAPRLADGVVFAPGFGFVFGQIFALFGAVLLISTLTDFVQQHLAFRKMIDDLLTKTDNSMRPLIERKFKRAPSAIKRYLGRRFRKEMRDETRLKLLELALMKPMWSIPLSFLDNFRRYGEVMKREGGARIVAFLEEDKRMRLDMRRDIIARAKERYLAFKEANALELFTDIILPCLEAVLELDQPQRQAEARRQIRQNVSIFVPLKKALDGDKFERAAKLLIAAYAGEFWADIIARLPNAPVELQVELLRRMTDNVNINAMRSGHHWDEVADAANDLLRAQVTGPLETGLKSLRAAISLARRGANATVPPMTEAA